MFEISNPDNVLENNPIEDISESEFGLEKLLFSPLKAE